MNKSYLTAIILLLFATQTAFSQVTKKTVVEHFTNTNCSICASKNPGFYTNLNSQTNVLHLAVHPSSPYPSCLLSQQNLTANDARTNYYGVYGGTPRLVINGTVISASANYSNSTIFAPFLGQTSPASIRIVQEKFSNDSIISSVIIKTEAVNSLGPLSLFVALAEDTIFYTGSNGESMHFDVFRKSLTNTIGDAVTLPSVVGDSLVFSFQSLFNPLWDFSRIYTMAILQETNSKNVVQAEAVSASWGGVTSGFASSNNSFKTVIYPNPTGKYFTIQLESAEPTLISITNIEGKIVLQQIIKQIENLIDISTFPNGAYLLTAKSRHGEYVQKIVKE